MTMHFHVFDHGPLGKILLPKEGVDPQEWAMLAAMYSRTTDSCEEMVEKVQREGPGRFMETYYVGYGHESIGDLVNLRIFLEGIPLFVAPLIEHYALFSGQESSTRYIDFSKQRLYGNDAELLEALRAEYLDALVTVFQKLLDVNRPDTASRKRSVKARAFDICRGLLPLGATTNVAWYGDIRSIKGHLAWMFQKHPWSRPWALAIYGALKDVYPASMERTLDDIRPRKPWVFDPGDGKVVFQGIMDFGSWRDLNRHRVGRHDAFRLPHPGARLEPWYDKMLTQCGFERNRELRMRAWDRTASSYRLLGQEVEFRYEMPESQADHLCCRRSQIDVHPTLRLQVQLLAIKTGRSQDYVHDVGLGYVEIRGDQTILHQPSLQKEKAS